MIIKRTSSDKIVFLYTTCADRSEARDLAFSTVNEKLAICADFWSVESVYPWQGVLQNVNQYMVMFTTKKKLSKKLADFVGGLHSYTVPMICETETSFTNSTYTAWADKTLRGDTKYLSQKEGAKRQEYEDEDGYHPGRLK